MGIARRHCGGRLLGTAGGLALCVSLLVALRPAGALPRRATLGAWLARTPADQALLTLTWLIGCAVVAWLSVAVVLGGASALPGILGNAARTLLRRLTPGVLRRLLELTMGISLVAGPVAGQTAFASPAPVSASSVSASSVSASSARVMVPALDRPGPVEEIVPSLDRPEGGATRAPSLDRPAATPAPRPAVTVRPGDSLWLIAARGLGAHPSEHAIAEEWPRWYAANLAVIGNDPDLIAPGQTLHAPAAAGSVVPDTHLTGE